ncbi:MAG: serine/threonine-protein kinase [bacterium]|nr:serine/threonine protein kinase [bacterium]MDT8367057.1 serine/threonine-protein kinase [bacterium]
MERSFGNYILHERVGIGGMGEVFRATKHGPDGFEVQVALKVILPHLAREESFKKRFSREANLAASLQHPNIVKVNGFDIIDGTPVIEMEYVPGADLRRILRLSSPREKLSLNESIAILYAVGRGLNHAHRQGDGEKGEGGIIHCDLNPHNILISTLGEVKIADFGIARAMLGDIAASATIRGKLAYMSPEQMEGRELDQATDLFSLGIIAYQLLSGNHPFDRGSEAATISAIGKAEHIPLRNAASGLPSSLYELVDRLLTLDPAERPPNAASVLEALEPLVLPSAVTSLASRVRSLVPETHHAAGIVLNSSLTAPTIPRSRRSRLWPYLAMGTAGIALVAGVFLLPTGMESNTALPMQIKAVAPEPVSTPSPQPEALPLEHTITLGSVPPGASILADGIPVGTTPVSIRSGFDDSTVNMEARLYGYRDEPFRIPPGVDEQYVVTLVPLPTGTVRISANPWARVIFRGEEKGYTPVTIPDVPVGKHTFILSYDPLGVERKVGKEVREGMNTVSVDMGEIP